MTAITGDVILAVFLVFCRIGCCMMVAPGLSSGRLPPQARLFVAVALSLALAPALLDRLLPAVAGVEPFGVLQLIFVEAATGLLIGFLGRLFFFALEFIGVVMAQSVGFGNTPGVPYEGEDASPTLASVLVVTATAMVFITDLHWEIIRGVTESYAAIPPSEPITTRFALIAFTDQLTAVFLLALRIASPFVIYSVMVNVAMGLVNKLTPSIPVYFVLTPLIMTGGLILLMLIFREFMTLFMSAFGDWLTTG